MCNGSSTLRVHLLSAHCSRWTGKLKHWFHWTQRKEHIVLLLSETHVTTTSARRKKRQESTDVYSLYSCITCTWLLVLFWAHTLHKFWMLPHGAAGASIKSSRFATQSQRSRSPSLSSCMPTRPHVIRQDFVLLIANVRLITKLYFGCRLAACCPSDLKTRWTVTACSSWSSSSSDLR